MPPDGCGLLTEPFRRRFRWGLGANDAVWLLPAASRHPQNRATLQRAKSLRRRDLVTGGLALPFVGRALSNALVAPAHAQERSEEHTSELQSPCNLVCRLLLEKKKKTPSAVQTSFATLYIEILYTLIVYN